jgi:hypothetical protein
MNFVADRKQTAHLSLCGPSNEWNFLWFNPLVDSNDKERHWNKLALNCFAGRRRLTKRIKSRFVR